MAKAKPEVTTSRDSGEDPPTPQTYRCRDPRRSSLLLIRGRNPAQRMAGSGLSPDLDFRKSPLQRPFNLQRPRGGSGAVPAGRPRGKSPVHMSAGSIASEDTPGTFPTTMAGRGQNASHLAVEAGLAGLCVHNNKQHLQSSHLAESKNYLLVSNLKNFDLNMTRELSR